MNDKKPILYRYMALFLAVIMLPLLLCLWYVQKLYMPKYRQQVIEGKIETGWKYGQTIENMVREAEDMAFQILHQASYSRTRLSDATGRYEIHHLLDSFCVPSRYIYEINLYKKDLDCVVSSRAVLRLDTLAAYYFRYNDQGGAAMLASLYDKQTHGWHAFRDANAGYKKPMQLAEYVYTSDHLSTPEARVVQILIDKTLLEKQLDCQPDDLLGIFMPDGTLFYASAGFPAEAAQQIPLGVSEAGGMLAIRNSVVDGRWQYVLFTSMTEAVQDVRALENKTNMLLLALSVLCIIAALIAARMQYRPIHQLVSRMHDEVGVQADGKNELAAVHNTMLLLNRSQLEMERKLTETSVLAQDGVVYRLLCGAYHSVEELLSAGAETGVRFRGAYFFVILAQTPEPQLLPALRTLLDAYELRMADAAVYLCSLQEENLQPVLELLDGRKAQLRGRLCVSTVTREMDMLYSKYVETMLAMNRAAREDERIVVYGAGSVHAFDCFQEKEIALLRQYGRERNAEGFQDILDVLLSFERNPQALFLTRLCVSYEMLGVLLQLMQEECSPRILKEEIDALTPRIIQVDKDLTMQLEALERLGNAVKEQISIGASKPNPIRKVQEFISQNCISPEMNAQFVADAMEMSLSNLSTWFRRETGVTLSSYITSVRMERCKALLMEKTYSVNEIAEMVGYATPSGFIRAFKQYEGVTPNTFREENNRSEE